ncbi:MAG: lipocalin family protein [Muribaculaceae bacterium]
MKQIAGKIILFAMMLIVASCTSNNGDIGPWFGIWRVTEITTDGVPDEDYEGNMFFKFQNTVFEMLLVYDDHSADTRFGTWKDEGNGILTVSFPDGKYKPLSASHMSADKNVLTFSGVHSSGFVLRLESSDGHVYTYRLVKW